MGAKFKAFLTPVLCVLMGLAVATVARPARGASIKELVKDWNKHSGEATVEDVLKTYAATTEKAKLLARDMAEQAVTIGKLQKTVRSRWGDDVEQRVAAACGSDTTKDDDEAEETIKDDHATLKFKNESLSPLLLVKSGGDWKIDCDAYVEALGQNLPEGENTMRAITAMIQAASKELASGKFSTAEAFEASLKKRLETINAGK